MSAHRGRCVAERPGRHADSPHATFSYLRSYLWQEIIRWQQRKHRRTTWKQLRGRYGIWPTDGDIRLFDPARVNAKRYYYRGTRIPTPWPSTT